MKCFWRGPSLYLNAMTVFLVLLCYLRDMLASIKSSNNEQVAFGDSIRYWNLFLIYYNVTRQCNDKEAVIGRELTSRGEREK